MKKNSTTKKSRREVSKGKGKVLNQSAKSQIRQMAAEQRLTIGLDLGDHSSRYCILSGSGEVVMQGGLRTSKTGLHALFGKLPASRVALEAGTHSPWVSRQVAELGHEVIVANPRKVALIAQSTHKDDRVDAETLGRLARVDPKLLFPIRHRGEAAQKDLTVLRARARLVAARTALINAVRGLAKPMGERVKVCASEKMGPAIAVGLSAELAELLQPMLKSIQSLTEQIGEYDRQIQELGKRYPEVELLTPVYGVGTLIGLAYMLTIEDPSRFGGSREVGAYLGLQPKRRESGDSKPQLGISKEGDRMLRSLLVQAAHCMLRRDAPDSDLRRWGRAKLAAGSKKKKVVIAVARKLAVLLHKLWANGEVYEPLYGHQKMTAAAA